MNTPKNQMMIDQLADAARQGRISRRSFMHYSMAAGMTATAATGLWTTQAHAEPKRGGTFRIAQTVTLATATIRASMNPTPKS